MGDQFKAQIPEPEGGNNPDMEQLQITDLVEESPKPEKPSTLFPKITGKVDEIVDSYNYKLKRENGFENFVQP
jgi:hypothetical protein